MKRSTLSAIFLLCGLMLGLGACRSDCTRLCDKQAECAKATAQSDDGMLVAKQNETCKTMCATMSSDPDRAANMEKAFACVDKSCGDFATCVKAAE